MIVTPSRLETAARCHRRHLLSDQLGAQGLDYVGEGPLAFGTVIHAAIADYWSNVTMGESSDHAEALAKTRMKQVYAENMGALAGDAKHTLELAEFMLAVYCREGKLAAENFASHLHWEPVVIENRLEVDLGRNVTLTFKLDRLVHCPETGMYVMVDSKTAGTRGRSFPSYWANQWPRSLQQRLYRWAVLESFGMESNQLEQWIEGLLKNVPTEVKYVQLPAWSESELEEAATLALHWGDENKAFIGDDGKLDVDTVLTAPNFNFGDCEAYFRPCPYTSLCMAQPEDRLGIYMAEFQEIPQEYLD